MHKKKIRGVTYYYTSVRENGNVKTIYLGRTRKEAARKEAELKGVEPIPSRTFRIFPRPWAYLGLVVLVMVVLFMGNGLVGYLASVSGPTELTGDFQAKLTMHAGTFLPRDAVIEIVFEDQISQLSIEDFLIRSGSDLQPEEGSFYSSEVDVA